MNPISIFLRSSAYTSNNGSKSKSVLVFELNAPIASYPNMDLLVSLKSFSFTNSFYTVNDNNSKLYYTYDNTNVVTFSCNHGNYTIEELITYLNTALTGVFIFTYSLRTLKVTITSTSSIPFRLISNNKNKNMYELLGFDDFITYSTLATSYEAPYLFNMMGIQVLHVCLPNLSLESIGLKNTTKYNIIDSIQVTATSGETQTYFNDNNFKYKINDNNITFLEVVIYDQDFNLVDFNNIDWFINLTFQHMYQKPFMKADYLNGDDTSATIALLLEEKRKLLQDMNI
jgi:hypothetical protein